MSVQSTPRLRMLAGPNGSGKSTIKSKISADLIGIYLNADDIEKEISDTKQLDTPTYHANAHEMRQP